MYYPEHSPRFAAALARLRGHKVAVLGHVRPDGDCIGSQVALTRLLRSHEVDAIAVNQHEVPPMCAGFVGDTPFFLASEADLDGRLAVSVDCADHKRLGEALQARFASVELNIDHHISNALYGKENLIDGASSATGELLAGIIFDLGYAIDAVTAQALYVGIATDTGQFRFSQTTKQTFDLCRALMDHGADPAAAALQLYERESPAKLALLQRFLASFTYLCEGRVCVGQLGARDFAETGARKEDTEGLVDYARSIEGVQIGVLLEEYAEGLLKGSFRAKDPVHRVDQLARQFNGGGHACAAGFNPGEPMERFYPRFLAALEAHFARH
jgi:bifunctional oligoribonuclease and PAP phosphatase NrnA